MITRIHAEVTGNAFIGTQHPPSDKVIGGEFPYLNGTYAGNYTVPANTKTDMKCMILSIRPGLVGEASRSAELAGIVNCGVASAYIGTSKMFERRIHEYMLPNLAAANELVTPFMNQNGSPSIGEGVIVPSGTTFYIKATPAQNSNIVWEMTIFGKRGTTTDIQHNIKLTATTTADQILFQYTPAADWTIMSIYIDAEAVGQVCGQARVDIDGRQIMATPVLGMGESTAVMFDGDSFAGCGVGALIIPMWGMQFYPGQSISFMPIPWVADQSSWGLTVVGNETTLATGTAGATSWAY